MGDDRCEPMYLGIVDRIAAIVVDDDVVGRPVPACPSWSGRDLLGHLAGIAQDWATGNLEGYASARWTAAQVERNATLTWSDLLDRWRSSIADLATAPPHAQLGAPWRWLFGDALVHEADLRETTTGGSEPPSDAVHVALDQIVARWRREVAATVRQPTLRLTDTSGHTWLIGTDATDGVAVLDVEAPAYELWRMLTGRRTLTQIRSLGWSTDPGRAFDHGLPYPFRLPA